MTYANMLWYLMGIGSGAVLSILGFVLGTYKSRKLKPYTIRRPIAYHYYANYGEDPMVLDPERVHLVYFDYTVRPGTSAPN